MNDDTELEATSSGLTSQEKVLRLAVDKGLITLDQRLRLFESLPPSSSEANYDLVSILLEKGLVSETQALELRAEIDSDGVPGFRLLRTLGTGGMGTVFLAEQFRLKRSVALKVIKPEFGADPAYVQRFRKEAYALARLNHPNIVQVFDFGDHKGKLYLALEYVKGCDAQSLLAAHDGVLDPTAALKLIHDAALGLSHAAEQGIIHRDVKPANLLIGQPNAGPNQWVVKISDLGLAREQSGRGEASLTQSGTILGTPVYMAPEQALGEATDLRSDIYALGATLFHFITGSAPFAASSVVKILFKKQHESLNLEKGLTKKLSRNYLIVLDKMLARDPQYRYQTYAELIDDINAVRKSRTLTTKFVPPEYSSLYFPNRGEKHFAKTIPAILAALVLIGAGAYFTDLLPSQTILPSQTKNNPTPLNPNNTEFKKTEPRTTNPKSTKTENKATTDHPEKPKKPEAPESRQKSPEALKADAEARARANKAKKNQKLTELMATVDSFVEAFASATGLDLLSKDSQQAAQSLGKSLKKLENLSQDKYLTARLKAKSKLKPVVGKNGSLEKAMNEVYSKGSYQRLATLSGAANKWFSSIGFEAPERLGELSQFASQALTNDLGKRERQTVAKIFASTSAAQRLALSEKFAEQFAFSPDLKKISTQQQQDLKQAAKYQLSSNHSYKILLDQKRQLKLPWTGYLLKKSHSVTIIDNKIQPLTLLIDAGDQTQISINANPKLKFSPYVGAEKGQIFNPYHFLKGKGQSSPWQLKSGWRVQQKLGRSLTCDNPKEQFAKATRPLTKNLEKYYKNQSSWMLSVDLNNIKPNNAKFAAEMGLRLDDNQLIYAGFDGAHYYFDHSFKGERQRLNLVPPIHKLKNNEKIGIEIFWLDGQVVGRMNGNEIVGVFNYSKQLSKPHIVFAVRSGNVTFKEIKMYIVKNKKK